MKFSYALGLAALGLPLLTTGAALADQSWQGYAPRCQPSELARDAALQHPCEAQVATFGLDGPTVLSRAAALDVQSTGSIRRNEPGSRGESRPPL